MKNSKSIMNKARSSFIQKFCVHKGGLDSVYLKKIIPDAAPTILEVGCNDGTHTKLFLEKFPQANIFCFEPDPRAIQRFNNNVPSCPQIKLFNVAISDQCGTVEFHISSGTPPSEKAQSITKDWDLSGSIKKPKLHLEKHPWCKFDEVINVKSQTLDSWVTEQQLTSIDLIWADVQGAEDELIRGSKEALKITKYLYTEYSNSELYQGQLNLKQLLALLPEFSIKRLYRNDVLLYNTAIHSQNQV